jgi:hypothetical protein
MGRSRMALCYLSLVKYRRTSWASWSVFLFLGV